MASTVYYGKSSTAAGTSAKEVRLVSNLEDGGLKQGDMLVVYFAYKNTVQRPTIKLYIGDSAQEISTSNDNGLYIKTRANEDNVAGAWNDGESITFVYTADATIGGVPNNTFYWEMIKDGKATSTIYGNVIIDGDNGGSAVSKDALNAALDLADIQSLNFVGQGGSIFNAGTLTLTKNNGDHYDTTIELPTYPTVQYYYDLGEFTNNPGYYKAGDNINVGSIRATGEIVADNNIAIAQNKYLQVSDSSGIRIDDYSNLDDYIGHLVRTELQPIVVNVKSRNLEYPASSAFPQVGANVSGAVNTDVESGKSAVYLTLPTQSGYTPIGIVGYQIHQPDNDTKQIPSKMNMWAMAVTDNSRIRCQLFNMRTETNIIWLSFRVLYKPSHN